MKTSETIAKIAPALVKAQKAISYAVKNESNPFFKNRYADLPAVIDAIKAPLNDAGIVFLQTPSPSDDGKLHLTTRLIHESGEWIEDIAVTSLSKQDPQGFGSAVTYLRRYSLASFIGLYQDDDDGAAACQQNTAQQKPKASHAPLSAQDKRKVIDTAKYEIEDKTSVAALTKVFNEFRAKFNNDKAAMDEITEACRKRKEMLEAASEDVPQ